MDKTQLRELIQVVLKEYDLYSRDAEELLMLTAATESNLGYYIKQKGGGPALGIFQCEPDTLEWADIKIKKRRKKCLKLAQELYKEKNKDAKSTPVFYFGDDSELKKAYNISNAWNKVARGSNLHLSFRTECECKRNSLMVMSDLSLQILMARMVYYFKTKKPIPNHKDIQGLAEYWKKYYNSVFGAGTVEGAIEKYKKYVKR